MLRTAVACLFFLQGALAVSTYLRGDYFTHRLLQDQKTPMDYLCNATVLDAKLDMLASMPECANNVWTDFEAKIGTDTFLKQSVENEAKELDAFCKTPCGSAFDKVVAEWRDYCDSPEATFEALADAKDDQGFRMDGFIVEYGCTKSASGQYCARLIMDDLEASDDDLAKKCPYYASCCFGSMHKLLRMPDVPIDTINEKCAGAKAGFEAKCASMSA